MVQTSLLQYLLLENIGDIACVLLFSNTGIAAYEKNYSWLNPRYIYDTWDDSIIDSLLKLGKRIKQHDSDKHLIVIFDDSIGMAKR
jgi:hypothetical protein